MDRLQQLEQALIKADQAGNTEDARVLAAEIRRLRAESAPPAKPAKQREAWEYAAENDLPLEYRQVQTIGRDDVMKTAGIAADIGLEGGAAAVGQAIGAATPLAPVAVPAFGAVGGAAGNTLAQLRQIKAGERNRFAPGEMGGAFVAGAIPGGSMARGGAKAVVREAAKTAGGNVLAKAAETGIDQNRMPTAGEVATAGAAGAIGVGVSAGLDTGSKVLAAEQRKMQRAVVDQTVAEAKAAGYKIIPSQINPSGPNKLLESLAGKAATSQEAALRNQAITNDLARRAIGVSTDTPLTTGILKRARDEAGQVYEAVANLSPDAATKLKQLREARARRTQQYDYYERSKLPEALDKAQELERVAETLEGELEAIASAASQPDLVKDLRAARERIAKVYDVERSLQVETGDVDAALLAKLWDQGKPLTGELAQIGKFADFNRQGTRLASRVPSPGVSALQPTVGAGVMATLGGQMAGWPGAATGAVLGPIAAQGASNAARNLVLSRAYQNSRFSAPWYPDGQDFVAATSRFGLQAQGR